MLKGCLLDLLFHLFIYLPVTLLDIFWRKLKDFCQAFCYIQFSSVQFSHSVVSDSWDPMDCSTPGLPVHHQLPEFTQTHVHWVSDAIQPSHPLSSPSPPAFNLSQHQGLFQWVSSSHQMAKVLEFQLQHQSYHHLLQWLAHSMSLINLPEWRCFIIGLLNK